MKKLLILTLALLLLFTITGNSEESAPTGIRFYEYGLPSEMLVQEPNPNYKIAQLEQTGKWGVYDCASGAWKIPPEFQFIEKPLYSLCRVDTMLPYIAYNDDGTFSIFDSETLQLAIHFDQIRVFGWNYLMSGYLCPGIFRFYQNDVSLFYSIPDGALLFEVNLAEHDSILINGSFEYHTLGYPQRLAMNVADDVTRCDASTGYTFDYIAASGRIIDLSGNAVSAEYNRVTPLIWAHDRGVFLAELWNGLPLSIGSGYGYDANFVYCGEQDFIDNWRCGLIDQDGNELTEIIYQSVQMTAGGSIILRSPDIEYCFNF